MWVFENFTLNEIIAGLLYISAIFFAYKWGTGSVWLNDYTKRFPKLEQLDDIFAGPYGDFLLKLRNIVLIIFLFVLAKIVN